MNALQIQPAAVEAGLSQHALLTGLATNFYLTALVLSLSNRLVASADTALITAIAQSAPPEVVANDDILGALVALGLDPHTTALCAAVLELQSRARRELELPSGPHRPFRPASNSCVALQRLWQAAAENCLLVVTSVLASSLLPPLARERLSAAHDKLQRAADGTLEPTADEIAGVLPVWIRRRRHVRQAISLPVMIWARDRRERGQALDVSQGGAMIVMNGTSNRGDKLQLEFPGRSLIAAIVQWGHDKRTGVKFVEPLHVSDPLLAPTKPTVSAI